VIGEKWSLLVLREAFLGVRRFVDFQRNLGAPKAVLTDRLGIEPPEAAAGFRTLRWSSAGHLPPLVLRPDGAVTTLDTRPETLLGAESTRLRTDHEHVITPGETLIFYTDGLVEHGRTSIDDGIARLVRVVGELGNVTVDELCDQLLERIVRHRADDDIAIVAVRCHPTEGLVDLHGSG
jgi:sigma-B regulation protein RsbU (phosphoserine phosphatase)